MSKFTIAAASAVIVAIAAASAAQYASAAPVPDDHMRCYYKDYYCSYPGTAYWSDCNPTYPDGFIRTDLAESICRTFHAGTAW